MVLVSALKEEQITVTVNNNNSDTNFMSGPLNEVCVIQHYEKIKKMYLLPASLHTRETADTLSKSADTTKVELMGVNIHVLISAHSIF
jgi:hypothetical protein